MLFKQEDFAEAAMGYETLVDLFPDGEYAPLAAFNAAVCYQEIEDWHAAIGGYVRFIADYPDHENAQGLWLQIAGLYQDELGDYRQAIEAYEHALAAGERAGGGGPLPPGRVPGEGRPRRRGPGQLRHGRRRGRDRTDPFRIAALARMAEIAEERGDWRGALATWQRIVDAGGKPEWTQMAADRIEAIRSSGVVGS